MTVSWQVHWGGSWCGNYYELLQFKTAILLSLIIKPWALIKSSLIVSKINISVWSKLHISYNKIFEYQMHQKCTWQLKRICDIFRSWFHILQNLVVLVKMSAHFNWIHLALFAVVKFSNEYFDKSFMAVYMYMYVPAVCIKIIFKRFMTTSPGLQGLFMFILILFHGVCVPAFVNACM